MTERACAYCNKAYTKNSEHVFPYGLGGQNIFMNCVCEGCNNSFAGLERELYQKSIVGLLRSVKGVEGYNPSRINPAPFKAPILLTLDKTNSIVFEIGQFREMKVFLRPQIYYFKDKYYTEADSLENRDRFAAIFSKWRRENNLLVARVNNETICVKFSFTNGKHTFEKTACTKDSKKAIQYCSLPNDHKLYKYLTPRLYMDDDGKLRLRAKTPEQAYTFLRCLLNDVVMNNPYGNLPTANFDNPIVDVGFSFDGPKVERALIKIGLNYLMHYYPDTVCHPSIKPCIKFVSGESQDIHRMLDQRNQIIDSQSEKHNIFFNQLEDDLMIRISLFNGGFAFIFWINNIKLLKKNNYNRILIDYRNRVNIFEDTNQFLSSFPRN